MVSYSADLTQYIWGVAQFRILYLSVFFLPRPACQTHPGQRSFQEEDQHEAETLKIILSALRHGPVGCYRHEPAG